MKGRRSRQPWAGLRVHEGGVRVRTEVDPREQLRNRLIDAWVAEYDAALKSGDHELAGRTAVGLRELGVRV